MHDSSHEQDVGRRKTQSTFEKNQTTHPERPEQKRDGESRSDEGPEMILIAKR